MNRNELLLLFELKEQEFMSTEKVVEYFAELCRKEEGNLELFFYLNKIFEEKGYGVRFVNVKSSTGHFDVKEYLTVISRIHTSKNKTIELLKFLLKVNNYRLTLASLYLFNFDNLVDLQLISLGDNRYLQECYGKKMNLDEVLYKNYFDKRIDIQEGIKKIKAEFIAYIGGFHNNYNKQFIHNEFLIETNAIIYSAKNYKYANSIRIAFKISDKNYYDNYINKPYLTDFGKVNDSLSYIKNKLNRRYKENIIIKYIDRHLQASQYFADGYSFFYNIVRSKYL